MQDPGALRFALAAVYGAGAVLSVIAALRSGKRERVFWFVAAIVFAALMLAKELHLIDEVTGAARTIVKARGWYGIHRQAQQVLAGALLLATLGCGWSVAAWLRKSRTTVRIAASALFVLLAILVLRAVSLHVVDKWSMATFAGMRWGWWAELVPALIVCVAAWHVTRRGARSTGS